MNGLTFKIGTHSQEGYCNIEQFRAENYKLIDEIIYSIFEEAHKLNPRFEYKIEKVELDTPYLPFSEDHQYQYVIDAGYEGVNNTLKINVPKLIKDTFFVLSNSYYIPTMALERLPLDKNSKDEKTFLTLNVGNTFFLFWEKKSRKERELMIMFPKNRSVPFEAFAAVAWVDRPEYIDELKELGIIKNDYSYNKIVKQICSTMELYNKDVRGRKMYFSDYMNQYYLLPYHKRLLKRIYGVDTFEDILYEMVKLHLNPEEEINLSDIRNRRLVFAEYLMMPVFSIYYRIANIIGDKTDVRKIIIPNMNAGSVIKQGFRNLLHAKQFYDISTPFATTLKYKLTQKISIVKDKIPQSWTELHDTHYNIIDPLAINPGQSYGASVSVSNNALVDEFGMFWVNGPQPVRTFKMPENLDF